MINIDPETGKRRYRKKTAALRFYIENKERYYGGKA